VVKLKLPKIKCELCKKEIKHRIIPLETHTIDHYDDDWGIEVIKEGLRHIICLECYEWFFLRQQS